MSLEGDLHAADYYPNLLLYLLRCLAVSSDGETIPPTDGAEAVHTMDLNMNQLYRHIINLTILITIVTLSACSSSSKVPGTTDTEQPDHVVDTEGGHHEDPIETVDSPEVCIPNKDVFEQNILPALSRSCTSCHSEPVKYGAPFPLLDYDAIVADMGGLRISDQSLNELMLGTMPPGNSVIVHEDLDTLVSWLSCGEEHPNPQAGVIASSPVFTTHKPASADYQIIDITAVDYVVSPTTLDHYEAFEFENLVTEDKFIRRFEPIIDDSRVLHHITLQYDLGSDSVTTLYAWAPGTGIVELPDGGLRLRPSDKLKITIHYNNGSGATDVKDSSGIRLYVDGTVGTEFGALGVITVGIKVDPHSMFSAVATCTASEEYTIFAGMPHMHGIGHEFKQEVVRTDGTREELFHLTGWSFEYQPFYEMKTTIMVGDRLEATCTYKNDTDKTVYIGKNTDDEMCINFMYVTPATVSGRCNEDNISDLKELLGLEVLLKLKEG